MKSTNEHGIHSPFIFKYLTNCLYKKPRKSTDKTLDILLKSIAYFQFKNVVIDDNSLYKEAMLENFPNLTSNPTKTDLILYNSAKKIKSSSFFSEYQLHNSSLILVKNIHGSPLEYSNWCNLIKSEKVTVSIDMFYCGALFIRKEQQKQHFTIRI
ncbi:hypothetical protein [Croceitalea sp. MTPC9]|uniref:hypothetical protein n=1 Tax=Croceitalea sp. MTPC9 TaxID=3056568 RepID=UPI0030D723F3